MIWKLAVHTAPEAEEALAELLSTRFGQPAASYISAETGKAQVAVYLARKPNWTAADRDHLREAIGRIKACGINVAPARVSLQPMRRENWAESWKRHFRPIEIGSTLLIKPSWSRRRPRRGQSVVVLDPGLSFGTGQHATTSFCLQQIVGRRVDGSDQSFLDIGTGSGILAIAAARLGYAPVRGFDSDPAAVRVARANARQNGVSKCVEFFRQDVAALPHQRGRGYSLICANLISNALLAQRSSIIRQLAPKGFLVLAGILSDEFATVQQAYETCGLKLVAARTEKEWRSGTFAWRSAP